MNYLGCVGLLRIGVGRGASGLKSIRTPRATGECSGYYGAQIRYSRVQLGKFGYIITDCTRRNTRIDYMNTCGYDTG